MRRYLVLLIAILIFAPSSVCTDIAYVSGSNGEKSLSHGNITGYKGTDRVSFTTSASPRGASTSYNQTKRRTVNDIKNEIDKKINRGNEDVRSEGLILAAGRSGAQRIDQICSIYEYLVGNWSFASDWRGLDEFQYSNYTLDMGKNLGFSGIGDCDDFSILLSALIESIGGTPRIILAYSPSGGHAYTEVYLGKQDYIDTDRMMKWLRKEYKVDDIYIHIDDENGDVWLNLDWWKDPYTGIELAQHPGGPFFEATSHVPISIQEEMAKSPLTPIENQLPIPRFKYNPPQPEVNDQVSFDASESVDPDGKIMKYEWDFGDGDTSSKSNSIHVYSNEGAYQANLTVTDDEGNTSTKTIEINIREPLPVARGTYSPRNPKVHEEITFDGSQSLDKSGQIIRYEWDFDDGNPGTKATMKHQYTDSGTYKVKLTVFNDKNLSNSTFITVDVGKEDEPTVEPKAELSVRPNPPSNEVQDPSLPVAVFSYNPTEPKAEEVITFSASPSVSSDEKIVNYEWDFGDGYLGKGVSISHIYFDSGTYNVGLIATTDKGRRHTTTRNISISKAVLADSKKESWTVPSTINPYTTGQLISSDQSTVPAEPTGNYATITIRSAQYQGFDVKVDGVLIGSDGKGGDALDGIYTFKVAGNQQHTIRAEHPYNWKWWQYPYNAGESYSYDF